MRLYSRGPPNHGSHASKFFFFSNLLVDNVCHHGASECDDSADNCHSGYDFRAEQHLIKDMSLLPPPYGVVHFYYEGLVRPSP